MNTDGSDIKPDKLVRKAIQKNKKALDELIVHPWMTATLNEVSGSTAAKYRTAANYGKDENDIKQILFVKMCESIDTVRNDEGREWCDCLKSWLYSTAGNLSLNDYRHGEVVKRHIDARLSDESVRGKLKSIGDSSHALHSSDAPEQEQRLLEEEQRALVEAAFERVLKLFPRHVEIMKLWREGLSVKEIAAKTGLAAVTVYRAEGKFVKALAKEVQSRLDGKRKAARHGRDSKPRRRDSNPRRPPC